MSIIEFPVSFSPTNSRAKFCENQKKDFQIICFLLDTHLTLLVSPIAYFPALLGVSHGFYSKILSIRTHYQINIIFTLIVLQITSLLCSFIKKHQSVAAIDQKRIMGTFRKYLIKVLLHIPPLLISVSFGFSNLDKAEEIEIANAEYPKLVHLLSLPNAELYSTSSVSIKITLVIMIGTFVLFCSLFLFYYIQILQMLHGHRQFMAARTYSKHVSAVLSLVAQLTVLVIWLAIPLAVLLGDVILHIEGFEAFCNLLICLFSTHSIMSTIVMVFTFPAFRRVVSCREKPMFSPATTMVQPRKGFQN
ncbi:Protein CBG24588 [Caenorhabditis briggsae]|uniref:Protein CBG24588 n=1 Tax=Caenorhabditis briggsae TaxID=6238 RepID=A8WL15_CAEBR|nr:Protein CBG24588 [Caenorhabditis briggsae]CAP21160.2 Protein CBG24588 [Caenorhabditis briggsae]